MIPDLEMVVKAMLRAMNEIIIPALPPNDSFALENAMLVVISLDQILQHGDRAYEIAHEELRLELRQLRQLQAILQSVVTEPSKAQQDAELIEKFDVPPLEMLVSLRAQLRAENEKLARDGLSDQSGEARRRVRQWSLNFSDAESEIPQMYRN